MKKLLQTRPLRFWVALGMVIAIAPLALSALLGFLIVDRGVVVPIHDVAMRQSAQMVPTQHLHLLLQDMIIAVDEFVEEGDPRHFEAARRLRGQIESGFVDLLDAVEDEPSVRSLVARAHDLWVAASVDATQLLSAPGVDGDPVILQAMQRYHGEIIATADELSVVSAHLTQAIGDDHDAALLNYERALWIAGIAGLLSLLAMAGGVYLIGRIIGLSVDRLVEGAARFAEGDRDHRIAIAVPPELRRVADEFNRMIGRVHQSEEALASLAHLDSLTGVPNRRSFDEALAEAWTRLQRHNEPNCLLMLDLDHFKRINDTLGHAAGDEALRAVATVMGQNVRPYDRIFRTGGEEFSVILPKTRIDEARIAAERLREAIAAMQVPFNGKSFEVTASIGVAAASTFADPKTVVEAADAALYEAKAQGRNRVSLSTSDLLQ